jgi:ribosome-binding protein aMBF1 (putative translation factor)
MSAVRHVAPSFQADRWVVANSQPLTIPSSTLPSGLMEGKGWMEKSIYTREYAAVLRVLRQARKDAGITQVQLAKKLRLTQSLLSKMERGETRLDIIQLRTICRLLGITLADFVERLERELAAHG